MSEIQQQIRILLVHRHTPEALELYTMLMKYTYKRVIYITKSCGNDRLSSVEVEDIVSDVMLQLINGSLSQFRGQTIPELIGFVRTVTDRRIWRNRTKRINERELLKRMKTEQDSPFATSSTQPDDSFEFDPDSPLTQDDELYLAALIQAGSKAEYARQNQLSRAAVTQRVKRIIGRIEAFTQADQLAVDSWLRKVARKAIVDAPLPFLKHAKTA